ncbi:RNAse E [Roseiarcus fermentans]|uniref:Ribonuclease E n=1 Tax=Roseiarcus fermentans TaxID=1473586 RepID=A0A366EKV2_9HYPH|nr:ribonuclease E/G [Roseiarcus fermentans]RBP03062.1 RNAse E [Roseiarcus fermentans]
MANKMIIDASHPEETRVVVLRGNRVEEFDFESASKRPLRGNIYLAKVTRVEPSLQAAFVDYGGNRHGFLAFSEIHPDYYQIPVADRQALLDEEAQTHHDEDEEPRGERRSRRHRRSRDNEAEARVRAGDEEAVSEAAPVADEPGVERDDEDLPAVPGDAPEFEVADEAGPDAIAEPFADSQREDLAPQALTASEPEDAQSAPHAAAPEDTPADERDDAEAEAVSAEPLEAGPTASQESVQAVDVWEERAEPVDVDDKGRDDDHEVTTLEAGSEERVRTSRKDRSEDEGEPVEHIGGDAWEEVPRRPQRLRRQYKIQEVIKRRQVMLVQVVKEERGNKGAALTSYLSLAGRYCVLMPNTARGGGISRKITNAQDRSRLKGIAEELDVPDGMGVILRTAGASRTKAEVKRDFEYLLRMWETVRETTLASSAPTLVYEEGSLIKRAIRDLYSKEVDEIVVAGESGYREARQFMRLLMPTHVNSVQLYRDTQPVFARAGVEQQLDAMFSNQVTLKSGGYIVINQTEALVAIDVNSGRSTREHNIEDTALRTNLEAADEIARQLRLRDLAGLIVVDFIDMEESRNNRAVERRIKDALKNDRARIQVGRISHFGLLEMSRQRIRTGVLEGSTVVCAHCQGAGVVRSTSSIALHVLRILEDALIKSATHDIVVRTRTAVALYILNQKRANLRDLERRFGVAVSVEADDTLTGATYHAIDRGELAVGPRRDLEPAPLAQDEFAAVVDEPAPIEEAVEEEFETLVEEEGGDEPEDRASARDGGTADDSEGGRRRRRRRRRRSGDRGFGESIAADAPQPADDGLAAMAEIGGDLAAPAAEQDAVEGRGPAPEGERMGRRSRRSRGGRNRFPPTVNGLAFDDAGSEPVRFDPPELEHEREPEHADFEPAAFAAGDSALDSDAPAAPPTQPSGEETEMTAPDRAGDGEAPAADEPGAEPLPTFASEEPAAPAAERAEEVRAAEPDRSEPVDETPRPRRTGWWQRARASIVGD